jgi:putative two-component system hydrogenase maturation factor HypX/HoxX
MTIRNDSGNDFWTERPYTRERNRNLSPLLMFHTISTAKKREAHSLLCLHIKRITDGIKGDRGPSSLDWAILNTYEEWGVTLLQAGAEMDAGDIWASRPFSMRAASKSHLYRHEVTEAAIQGLLETIAKVESKNFVPEPLDYSRKEVKGRLQASMKQADRAVDWTEPSASILKKIRCADSFPGILDTLLGMQCYLYGAHTEDALKGIPGEIIATRDGAICLATGDGAMWITHLKQKGVDGQPSFKLPATLVLGDRLAHVP